MLDMKSAIYGALKYGNAPIVFKRDRAYYNVLLDGQSVGWLSLEELQWIQRKGVYVEMYDTLPVDVHSEMIGE